MSAISTDRIRNVALVGHSGSGKTSLAESLALFAKVISRKGRVEDGNTISDFEPEEQKHLVSISTSVLSFEYDGYSINLLDTPGYSDFFFETQNALQVADMAVFVINAQEGVETQTQLAWKYCQDRSLPRILFVNKLDKDRADFEETLESLRNNFGAGIAPIQYPIGTQGDFVGLIDLLSDEAFEYSDGVGSHAEIPAEIADKEHSIHDNLVEGIVVADDALMEQYLEGETPSYQELEKALGIGVKAATVFPVLVGSVSKDIGVDHLITAICEIGPSPLEVIPEKITLGDHEVEIVPSPSSEPLAIVFKTLVDPFVGSISYLKVLTGTIKTDQVLFNPRTKSTEKLHNIVSLFGNKQTSISQVGPGDFCAALKLSGVITGDSLVDKSTPVRLTISPSQSSNHVQAIAPVTQGDDDKLMTSLRKLQEEDPNLAVRRDDQSHQVLLSTTGELHFVITCEKLLRKYGVQVVTQDLVIAFKETITTHAQAEGRYKKQSGGHGQFGVCSLRIEPLERGKYFEFKDEVVGGAIPKQFLPAVEKGVLEAMTTGGKYGYPIVDVSVTCFDGKHHPVDSSEMSFKMAGLLGFREAYEKAIPVVLEPIERLEVSIPTEFQGDVLGDLNSKRAKIVDTSVAEDGYSKITALVPAVEMTRYALELKSQSAGRGTFSRQADHYEEVPPAVLSKMSKN